MTRQQMTAIRAVRDRVRPEEGQKRVDLAARFLLIDLYGTSEPSANHVTTRVPGEDGAFLINSCTPRAPPRSTLPATCCSIRPSTASTAPAM
ncbi:MAG: hypothetical protein JNK67_14070 [Alphaproteobacteria bacterium]|nr:hypothetical protein [Alphaproteobacteria bacterium]